MGRAPVRLAAADWRARETAHTARVQALLAPHLDRRERGEAHPVWDFLWTYYETRPARLRRWHPGPGVVLLDARERLSWRGYGPAPGTVDAVALDVTALGERRLSLLRWVRALLSRTAARPASYGCFGLHEWAMVYEAGPGEVRHAAHPLRLGAAGTDAVVRSHRVACSHFDAHRFFTPAARPRNALSPTRERVLELEQPGCLHATMDLYKWVTKLDPVVPSELVVDCLELALDVRSLDMRASPYDLRSLGFAPVAIETPAGKAAYVAEQRALAVRGQALRGRLLDVLDLGDRDREGLTAASTVDPSRSPGWDEAGRGAAP